MYEITIQLPFNGFYAKGILSLPVQATSLIIFSPDFEDSLTSLHYQGLADKFHDKGFGTLHLDLIDQDNKLPEDYKRVDLLSYGLFTSIQCLYEHSEYRSMDFAFFGTGVGSDIALSAAARLGSTIKTVVSLSGRMDISERQLSEVSCPVLLMIGELDSPGMVRNKNALEHLSAERELVEIPCASHLFKEQNKLTEATPVAVRWFQQYLSHAPKTSLVS